MYNNNNTIINQSINHLLFTLFSSARDRLHMAAAASLWTSMLLPLAANINGSNAPYIYKTYITYKIY